MDKTSLFLMYDQMHLMSANITLAFSNVDMLFITQEAKRLCATQLENEEFSPLYSQKKPFHVNLCCFCNDFRPSV